MHVVYLRRADTHLYRHLSPRLSVMEVERGKGSFHLWLILHFSTNAHNKVQLYSRVFGKLKIQKSFYPSFFVFVMVL
ncbi:hypothetical protein EYF80_021229 [Liparis tanakae]|uniref:Uncharacterized protein n=1 Tax=Liparis tanakae TaxID=230148 RepID=A0A4Z2HUE5_9TELE|nr:hypothetical protein EYF80_021229 [Liparis tanakae]